MDWLLLILMGFAIISGVFIYFEGESLLDSAVRQSVRAHSYRKLLRVTGVVLVGSGLIVILLEILR